MDKTRSQVYSDLIDVVVLEAAPQFQSPQVKIRHNSKLRGAVHNNNNNNNNNNNSNSNNNNNNKS